MPRRRQRVAAVFGMMAFGPNIAGDTAVNSAQTLVRHCK
jgi:hypothetical protein